jgi:signal peptidase I
MKVLDWLYSLALRAYPHNFRARFGREMRQVFRTRCRTAPRLAPVLISTICDLIATSFKERWDAMMTPRFARRLAYIATTAVLFLAASATVVRAYVIPTPSMEPTLVPGDHLIVDRLARTPQSQQLVVFRYPLNPSQIFIKRVIGLPGDHIRIVNKHVIRNDRELREDYTKFTASTTDSYRDNFPGTPGYPLPASAREMLANDVRQGAIVVPAGALFVMGDNRDASLDSRYFGFVPLSNVIGRPLFVYWSYDASARHTRWDRTLFWPHNAFAVWPMPMPTAGN